MVSIYGNTYPVKEQLKALGARWDKDARVWMIDESRADEARRIVAGAGERRPAETRTCWECGCSFTHADCRKRGGDWSDSYCGC